MYRPCWADPTRGVVLAIRTAHLFQACFGRILSPGASSFVKNRTFSSIIRLPCGASPPELFFGIRRLSGLVWADCSNPAPNRRVR